MCVKDGDYLGDLNLVFILHWNIYSVKREEPERMLGSHKESLEGLQVSSRVFQRIKVPSRRTFQGYLVFYGIPRTTLSQGCEFQTLPSIKGNRFETQ
jgi:hypothetical protein